MTEPIHASECFTPPYEGNEDVWESRPRRPGVAPKALARHATAMLKAGRLHPDAWAKIDDMILAGEIDEATAWLELQVSPTPIYPVVPGPRGTDT